jgi:N-methylhydantoinase A/oxoprolinase/acetone carboxylase beta subunit
MGADTAQLYPVLTFASGPTNSMRGAAFLSGIRDALVLDVGGTTSDIGALTNGFPRTAAIGAAFAGVQTGFRMPDLISFGLGGGSVVRGDEPVIGPDSVGHWITERALVFGGDTLTATDLAVRAGRANVGDASRVEGLDPELTRRGVDAMQRVTEEKLDHIKLRRGPEPVIVVGGGSVLIPDALQGASSVIRPDHFEVANAVGAAIAQVSGEVDTVLALNGSRDQLLAEAQSIAVQRAQNNGALGETIEVVEREDIPVPYMERAMIRIRVKVVGDLDTAVVTP